MSSRLRVTSLAALAIAALPVLSACNTSPGAAAVIGSQKVSIGDLQGQVKQSLASGALAKQTGFNQTTFTREILAHMISVKILNAEAADRKVSVTSKDVSTELNTFISQAGSLATLKTQAASGGVSAQQLNGFVRYDALEAKLGSFLIAKLTATPAQLQAEYQKDIDQFDQVDIAQIEVKTKPLAQHILRLAKANPASFGTLAEKYSLDTATKAKGGEVGDVATSQVQKALGTSAAPITAGSFAIASVSGEYDVIHFISRSVQPESQVTAQLKAALYSGQTQKLLTKAAVAEGAKLGVHVSPRYGRWDNATQSVVAVKSAVSSSSTAAPSTGLSPAS